MGKMARKAKRKKVPPLADGGQTITLENPVAHNFESYIGVNAASCERVVQPHSAKGKHIVICGAGPSLRDHIADYADIADEVWGCNSALVWLANNGHRVTHGFTVDQTPHMLEEWGDTPDVEYYVASTVDPNLVELLNMRERRVSFFHNYVGIQKPPVAAPDPDNPGEDIILPYEDWLYMALFPEAPKLGSGMNTATRAVDLAIIMGAERITLLGADHALRISGPAPDAPAGSEEHMRWLREETEMHADGGHALASEATPVTLEGEIDGRLWVTKPDMMLSAIFLVEMARCHKHLEIIGDTLPGALMDKDDKFLDKLPSMRDHRGRRVRYTPPQGL